MYFQYLLIRPQRTSFTKCIHLVFRGLCDDGNKLKSVVFAVSSIYVRTYTALHWKIKSLGDSWKPATRLN